MNYFGFHVYQYYIMQDIIEYHCYMLFNYYIFLIYCVNKELQEINQKLVSTIRGNKKERLLYNTTENINLLKERYIKLFETVTAINKLFDWQMLFLTGYSSVLMLSLFNLSVWILDEGLLFSSDIYRPLIMNTLMVFAVVVRYQS